MACYDDETMNANAMLTQETLDFGASRNEDLPDL